MVDFDSAHFQKALSELSLSVWREKATKGLPIICADHDGFPYSVPAKDALAGLEKRPAK